MEQRKYDLRQPIGRVMSKLGKLSLEKAQAQLYHLDINRSFYPLILIDLQQGMTQQELADMLVVDKVQVVRIVDYLSQHGYVQRVMNPNDRRKYQLTVTEKAIKAMPQIKQALNEVTNNIFEGFSSDEIDTIYDMLGRMENNLKR